MQIQSNYNLKTNLNSYKEPKNVNNKHCFLKSNQNMPTNKQISFSGFIKIPFLNKKYNYLPANVIKEKMNQFISLIMKIDKIDINKVSEIKNQILDKDLAKRILIEEIPGHKLKGAAQCISYKNSKGQITKSKIQMNSGINTNDNTLSLNLYSPQSQLVHEFSHALEKNSTEQNAFYERLTQGPDRKKALKKYNDASLSIERAISGYIQSSDSDLLKDAFASLAEKDDRIGSVFDRVIDSAFKDNNIRDKNMAMEFFENKMRDEAKAHNYGNFVEKQINPQFQPLKQYDSEFYNMMADYIKNLIT